MTPTDIDAAWFALARDFTYTGPHDRYAAHGIVADHRPRIEAAILANGAAFLPDAAELDRLRAALQRTLAALEDEDRLAHGEAVKENASRIYIGLGVCAYCDQPWPCRTERKSVPVRAALRAVLAPEGSARDGG